MKLNNIILCEHCFKITEITDEQNDTINALYIGSVSIKEKGGVDNLSNNTYEADINRDGANDSIKVVVEDQNSTKYSIDLNKTGEDDFIISLKIGNNNIERKVEVDGITYTDDFTETDDKYSLILKKDTTELFTGTVNNGLVDKIVNELKFDFTTVLNNYESESSSKDHEDIDIGLNVASFNYIKLTSDQFKNFYNAFLQLYDSSAQDAAKNNLKTFFENSGNTYSGNSQIDIPNDEKDSIVIFNMLSGYLSNDTTKLAKIINLNYNIKPSYIFANNTNMLDDFFKKLSIIFVSKYPYTFPRRLSLNNLDELTFTYFVAQLQINFKSDYNYFLLYFFDLLNYIITTRDAINKDNNYSFTDNFETTVEAICNYVRTNTLFDLRRTMRKDGLNKFREIFVDSDNDKIGDFADLLPNDNRGVKMVKTISYYTHKTVTTSHKYVKKVVTKL